MPKKLTMAVLGLLLGMIGIDPMSGYNRFSGGIHELSDGLGVLPLAYASGAGSGARNSVGTTVAGGMLASTFLSIIFIPVLYVAIRTIAPGRKHRGHTDEDVAAETGAAHA